MLPKTICINGITYLRSSVRAREIAVLLIDLFVLERWVLTDCSRTTVDRSPMIANSSNPEYIAPI